MRRGWLMFLIGAWVTGTVLVGIVAAENFYTIDRLLIDPGATAFHAAVGRLGEAQTRELLRYLSSELNRLYFQLWNFTQLAMGIPMLWLTWRTPGRVRWGVAVMLGIVVLLTVGLNPWIVSLGRSLDFVPRDPEPRQFRTFWILHGIYMALDLAQFLIGVTVAFWIEKGTALSGELRHTAFAK